MAAPNAKRDPDEGAFMLEIIFAAEVDRRRVNHLELLEAIGRTGSISAAGRELGISYRTCWTVIGRLNAIVGQPVVIGRTGGGGGGGSTLTLAGQMLATEYRKVAHHVHDAGARLEVQLQALGRSEAQRG